MGRVNLTAVKRFNLGIDDFNLQNIFYEIDILQIK